MKINYLIHEFTPYFLKVLTPLKELMDQSYDGNVFLNEITDPIIIKEINSLNADISQFIKDKFKINTKCIHWGFRNERGRKIVPEGHIHVRSEAVFSAVTCIYGAGTWVTQGSERLETAEGQTILLVEQRGHEEFPHLFSSPINHGGPNNSDKRLIFLSSFEAI